MGGSKVDYDRLASRYNSRYKFSNLAGVAAALEQIRRGCVLEIGCGTGHWLRSGDFGVDLSPAMLAEVRHGYVANADATHLPFRDGSFDVAFAVNAIHHFPDMAAFVRETARVLRPGGTLAVIGIEPRLQRNSWWIYDYFERAYERDLERFPSWGKLTDLLLAAGFETLSYRVADRVVHDCTGAEILNHPFLAKDSGSQLVLLTDNEYARGLERIQAAVRRDPELLFRAELTLGMITARL